MSTENTRALKARQVAIRGRAPRSALHAGVDFGFDQAIDGKSGAGKQPDADRAGDQRTPAGEAFRGEKHADHCTENRQQCHPRLGRRPVLGDPAAQAQAAAQPGVVVDEDAAMGRAGWV
jgi:hypothetical protein